MYDQGQVGSCTANALAAVVEFEQARQRLPSFSPSCTSRLYIYWYERALEGTTAQDCGAMLRDGIKALANYGVPREIYWAYDAADVCVEPPEAARAATVVHKALKYLAVPQDLHTLKAVIASGQPFVFSAYDSFEGDAVARTGVLPMPGQDEAIVGGYAVVGVGYDDQRQVFLFGTPGGRIGGTGGLLDALFLPDQPDLASDFWVISLVGAG